MFIFEESYDTLVLLFFVGLLVTKQETVTADYSPATSKDAFQT
jgi:hypothetical protein